MAITKLMNIRASKKGSPSTGLKNCLHYILKPEKTSGRLWVGGNAGSTPEEILDTFLHTKKHFEKMDQRQGYHFVISFSNKDQVSAEMMYQVTKEFCEKYLGEHYDYCFAVHTDQPHMHSHICFNSVSRTDGLKYHYQDGDWEKYIQPITDAICRKYGLPELKFEKRKRKGMNRAEYNAQKAQRPNRRQQLALDIDTCIQRASSYEEFLKLLRQGYDVQVRVHRKKGFSYLFFQKDGWKNGLGNYNLGPGYQVEEIKKRILHKEPMIVRVPTEVTEKIQVRYKVTCFFQQSYLSYAKRLTEIRSPFEIRDRKEFLRAQKDMKQIDKILEEIEYLIDNNFTSVAELNKQMEQVEFSISDHKRIKKKLNQEISPQEKRIVEAYLKWKQNLRYAEEDRMEEIEDLLEDINMEYPTEELLTVYQDVQEKIKRENSILKELKHEKRILEGLQELSPVLAAKGYQIQEERRMPSETNIRKRID